MRSSAKATAYCAILTASALLLSYLESLLPLIPFPGFKLGLANLAIMLAFFKLGLSYAFFVSLCRTAISALLFGSPISLLFSVSGAILSLTVLILYRYALKKFVGAIGLGVLSAAMHCIGQTLAASFIYGFYLLISYLPWLLLLSLLTGTLTGWLLHLILNKLGNAEHSYNDTTTDIHTYR